MKLRSIAKNQTEITFNDGTVVFFSYDTPVAAYDAVSGKYIRTDCPPVSTYPSPVSFHTNKWLETEAHGITFFNLAENVDQSVLDRIVDQGRSVAPHKRRCVSAHKK